MRRATKVTGIAGTAVMAAALIGGAIFLTQDPVPNVDPLKASRAYAGDLVAIPDGVFRVPQGLSVAFIARGLLPEHPCGGTWWETLKHIEEHGKPASDLCAFVLHGRRWSFHPCLKEVPLDPEVDSFALSVGIKTKYVPEASCEAFRERYRAP